MLTEQIDKRKVYWNDVLKFMETTFPKLESDLEKALPDLQTIQPILSAQNYCPRFSLQFFPKGMIKGRLINNLRDEEANLFYEIECSNVPLLTFQEKELKDKQQRISLTIAEIGRKYNLIARPGIIVLRKVHFGLGCYTLAPKYNNFIK